MRSVLKMKRKKIIKKLIKRRSKEALKIYSMRYEDVKAEGFINGINYALKLLRK